MTSAYLLAVPTLMLLYLASASLGVRLAASQWPALTGLILVGLIPFVVIRFVLGYLMPVDALTPGLGRIVVPFSLFGGVYGFDLASRARCLIAGSIAATASPLDEAPRRARGETRVRR